MRIGPGVVVVLCLAVVSGFGLSGCARPASGPVTAVSIATTTTPTPEQVVRQYYAALASNDTSAAGALETAHWRQDLAASDYHGVEKISLKNFKMEPFKLVAADGTRPDYLKSYAEIRETYVSYDLLKATPFEDAGSTGRFVMVVRETPTSPWRVNGTGTGP